MSESFTRRGFLGLLGGAAASRFVPASSVTPAESITPTFVGGPATMFEGDVLTMEHLLATMQMMRDAHVPAFEDGDYRVHLHPDALADPDVRAYLGL